MLNLTRFVEIHVPLDNFDCFKFENYLQEIKKSIKSTKYILQEINNRIIEQQYICKATPLKPFQPLPVKEWENRIPSILYTLIDKLFENII